MDLAVHEQEKLKEPFRNEHLSVSRIKTYEQCPLRFKLSYVDGHRETLGKEAADLGSMVHRAFELIYDSAKKASYVGEVPDRGIIKFYRQAFEESQLAGDDIFQLGLSMVRAYLAKRKLDHQQILGVERKITLQIHGFEILGYIDRIDKIDEQTVKVVDYKTSKWLYSKEETDHDLQMSVYGLAVLELFGWVNHVQYEYEMVRHNVTLSTSRAPEQLASTFQYLGTIGRRIESAEHMPGKLNEMCPWCDHRGICHLYQEALKSGEETLRYQTARGDLHRISQEREQAAILERIAKNRKKDMDKLLRRHISEVDSKAGLVVNGVRYKLAQRWNADYPRDKTIDMLTRQLSARRDMIEKKLVKVTQESIEDLLKDASVTSSKRQLIRFELDRIASRYPCSPYVSSRKIYTRR